MRLFLTLVVALACLPFSALAHEGQDPALKTLSGNWVSLCADSNLKTVDSELNRHLLDFFSSTVINGLLIIKGVNEPYSQFILKKAIALPVTLSCRDDENKSKMTRNWGLDFNMKPYAESIARHAENPTDTSQFAQLKTIRHQIFREYLLALDAGNLKPSKQRKLEPKQFLRDAISSCTYYAYPSNTAMQFKDFEPKEDDLQEHACISCILINSSHSRPFLPEWTKATELSNASVQCSTLRSTDKLFEYFADERIHKSIAESEITLRLW
jgi:hypothetical protein